MRILIIGAGVLGSNLAHSIKKGNGVTILPAAIKKANNIFLSFIFIYFSAFILLPTKTIFLLLCFQIL